jgi:hypothetical protein
MRLDGPSNQGYVFVHVEAATGTETNSRTKLPPATWYKQLVEVSIFGL